jgi:hypothetical protein
MPVAAQNPEDALWYRAEVTDLMQEGFLKVLFVDYGNDKVLHISKVRKLPTRLLSPPIQVRKHDALICRLQCGDIVFVLFGYQPVQ